MNKDFALGYLLGQGNKQEDKPQEFISDDWTPDYERPVHPEIRTDCKFTYILARELQIAELKFYVDCAGIEIDWGDGLTDTSELLENGKYGFRQNNNTILYHCYSTYKTAVWIKVIIPLNSNSNFNTMRFSVREVIRNCGCLRGLLAEDYNYLKIESDTCYCEDDYSYTKAIDSIHKEIILGQSSVIKDTLTINSNYETVFLEITGTVPARKLNIGQPGAKLRSVIINDASNITDISNKILTSSGTMLRKFIVLNAFNVKKINTAISSLSNNLHKVQIISSDKEIDKEGIIVDCPLLEFIGPVISDKYINETSITIKTKSKINCYLEYIDYNFKEFYLSAQSLQKPIYMSLNNDFGNQFKLNVKRIVADISDLTQQDKVWGDCFFDHLNLNSVFSTIEEFYPPYVPCKNQLFIISFHNFMRALSRKMVKIPETINSVTLRFKVPMSLSALTEYKGNSFGDINKLIDMLPVVESGKLNISYNSNGHSPKLIEDEIKKYVDYKSAESKNWIVIT